MLRPVNSQQGVFLEYFLEDSDHHYIQYLLLKTFRFFDQLIY